MYHSLALGRVAIKVLEKIFRCGNMSLPMKIRSVQGLIFPVAFHGRTSCTLKKQVRDNIFNSVLGKTPENILDSQGKKKSGSLKK